MEKRLRECKLWFACNDQRLWFRIKVRNAYSEKIAAKAKKICTNITISCGECKSSAKLMLTKIHRPHEFRVWEQNANSVFSLQWWRELGIFSTMLTRPRCFLYNADAHSVFCIVVVWSKCSDAVRTLMAQKIVDFFVH